jgi:hypothetical protein
MFSYISSRSKGKSFEKCSNAKVEKNYVGILGPIGCNINGGARNGGRPP